MIPQPLAIAAEAEDAALDRVLKHDLRKPGLDEKARDHRRAKRRTNRALRNLGLDLPNGRARHDAVSAWLGRPSALIRCAQEIAKKINGGTP